MKGQLLHIDHAFGQGVISGTDGKRYSLAAADMMRGDEQFYETYELGRKPWF